MVEKEVAVEESLKPKETRLEMRLPVNEHTRIKLLADYAANQGIIPEDHRGNITGFINWCIALGEGTLKEHALINRGF